VEPTPEDVGAALERLARDRVLARRLGAEGRVRAGAITWSAAVATLLQTREELLDGRRGDFRKVVMATASPAGSPGTAEERRCLDLARILLRRFDVEIVAPGAEGPRTTSRALAPGLVETVVPRPPAPAAAAGVPELGPAYVEALRTALEPAAAVVLSSPLLRPALAAVSWRGPVVCHAASRELDVVSSSEAVSTIVAAQEDAELLVGASGVQQERIVVAPHGIDPGAIAFCTGDERAAARARWLRRVMSGERGSTPDRIALLVGPEPATADAARAALELVERLPNVLLVIAGQAGRVSAKNVVALGVLSPVARRALLRAADVALVPVSAGEDVQLDVVECLAYGVPIVSTPAGVHDLPVEHDVHALVSEPPSFATAVEAVLADDELAARLAFSGRQLVDEQYDRRAVEDSVLQAVEAAVDLGPAIAGYGTA
jgi:glycosyltransferase involved in cell wall biosynthesis